MDGRHDLEVILRSRTPIVVIETRDEARILEMLQSISMTSSSQNYQPLFRWTITDGLQRLDIALEPQALNSDPTEVLKHIRAVSKPGTYVLLDFHPFLSDPVHIRLIKDICIRYRDNPAAARIHQPYGETARGTREFQCDLRHGVAQR